MRSSTGGLRKVALGVAVVATAAAALAATAGASPAKKAAAPAYDAKIAALLPDSVKQSKKISFGALWETPPVISADPKNPSKPVGLAVDLTDAVAAVLGITPVYKNTQWPAQIPGLQSGAVDVLWGQISDTKEREQSVADIVAWMQDPMALLLAGGNPKGVKSLQTACGLKIAVPPGSTMEALVKGVSDKYCAGKSAISTVNYPGAKEAIVAIKAGTVDGWTDAGSSIADVVKKDPKNYSMVPVANSLVMEFTSNISGIAVNKKNTGITLALAAALKKIAAPGGAYATIMKKYGLTGATMKAKDIKVNTFTGIPAGKTA